MRLFLVLVWAGLLQANISLEEYKARREALRKALPGAVILVAGATEAEKGGLRDGFFQESNFLYLSGWREPNAWLLLAPGTEILFLPKRSEVRERYTGRKLDFGDSNAREVTGFAEVADAATVDESLKEFAARSQHVYAISKSAASDKAAAVLGEGRTIQDLVNPLARLRMIKSAREIELIRASTLATIAGHQKGWQLMGPGVREYQIAATMGQVYFDRGCERHAYSPIVASGPNSIVLHYARNRRKMDSGELLLMDVGAECADYAADITRTVPVSGKFTARQRKIYDIVLGAQKAAIAAAKPGMKLLGTGTDSLNGIALKYVNAHGKDKAGEPLGKYYLHSLGHHVGLDVHDPTDPEFDELKPGMIVTIEPGIYVADEGIGVRIEDMILITENGCEVLSKSLPRDAPAIEKALRRVANR